MVTGRVATAREPVRLAEGVPGPGRACNDHAVSRSRYSHLGAPTDRRGRALRSLAPLGLVAAITAGCGTPGVSPSTSGAGPHPATTRPAAAGWSAPSTLSNGVAVAALACASSTHCVALDAAARPYLFGSKGWIEYPAVGPPPPAGQPGPLLACGGASLCIAVPSANLVAMWNGISWSSPAPLPGARPLQAVGCAPGSFCAAIDGIGDGFTFDGSSWSAAINAWGSASAISCVSPSFCMAAGGGLSQWNGTSWSKPDTGDPLGQFAGISCPSTSFCVTIDSAGNDMTWNGTSWSPPRTIDPATTGASPRRLTAISCGSPQFCVAGDSTGHAMVWNGTDWSAPAPATAGTPITALSCPTVRWCMAGTSAGTVLSYRRP